MIGRALLIAAALTAAGAGAALAAGFAVDADDLTVVRIPGAVPVESCTITAVADAYIDEAAPDATAGTAPALEVAAGAADRRALVRFDIGSCAIPSGADVRTAQLELVLTTAPGASRSWTVRRINDPWTGLSVTWNTAPAVAATATAAAPTGTVAGATVAWDVLPDVADVVTGAAPDRGWLVADADEATPAAGAVGASEAAAAADRPSLTITWFD